MSTEITNSKIFGEIVDEAIAGNNRLTFYPAFLGRLQAAMRKAEEAGRESLSLDEITEIAEEIHWQT